MLILVLASSYSLVRKLNSAAKIHTREQVTSRVLTEAKQALISYAVTFPERSGTVDVTAGPGYMSCPDTDNNGSPNPCGPSVVGRFPGEFWGVNSYLDSSGQRLWYAVSANFRNIAAKFQPMNSDTPAQLSVDGIANIVAVIIAPGEPVGVQVNRPSNNVADYLEGDNATTGDNSFTLNSGGNDVLVYITRQELMAAIEKRVLGDVEDAINKYQFAHAAFPWLSPFSDPSASTFRGTINTWQGHLPFHWSSDPDSISQGGIVAGRNPFTTDPSNTIGALSWSITVNTDVPTPTGTITAACLNDINCNDGLFSQITELPLSTTFDCTWVDKTTADCSTMTTTRTRAISYFNSFGDFCFSTGTRTYTIDFPVFVGVFAKNDPTSTTIRSRNVSLVNQVIADQVGAITITDTVSGGFGPTCASNQGTGSLDFTTATGTLVINGIQYDLDIDDGELPSWFVNNKWQDLIYLAYASGETLPGDTTAGQDCVTLAPCITVTNANGSVNNVRATVLTAGVDLPTGNARPSGALSDYFDGDNSSPIDDSFVKNRITTTYNDQTRIISTAP